MATKEEQRRYWATLEKLESYSTIEFYHPDFGHVYLVANKFFEKTFSVDGVNQVFTPVHAEVPENLNSTKDQSFAKLKFGRIGIGFRQKLRMVVNSFTPIQCNLRTYIEGINDPTNEYKMFIQANGIEMDDFNVTVTIGYDNPAKLSVQAFYDPSLFSGLQNL